MRVHKWAHKAPALRIIEEDVEHSAVHIADLAAVRPEFHAEKQRYSSVPRILEGEIKVPAAAIVHTGALLNQIDCKCIHPKSVYMPQSP
jgi:hypothetical protein